MPEPPVNDPEPQGSAPADRGSTEPASAAPSRSEADALAVLRKEKDTLQDRLLRTAAEFDNYRKRVDRERRELVGFVPAHPPTETLPVPENLQPGLQGPARGGP